MPSINSGPLAGVRVVEFASIGHDPHCCMLLSDMGAEVLRITRSGGSGWPNPIVDRGRHSIELDLRSEAGRDHAVEALRLADVVVEGYRPGVMERLRLGPAEMLALNPRLIYGRVTGWGQSGALAKTAGHDMNFIALSGALRAITASDGLSAAIIDGLASMMTTVAALMTSGRSSLEPKHNILGGRALFYRCYECTDGKYLSVGPIEPAFYAQLLKTIGAPAALADGWSDQIEGVAQNAPAPHFSRTLGMSRETGDGNTLLERWRAAAAAD